jgi:predicted transcriptional regulator
MSAMSIRLPESLHRNARAYAEQEGVSVNQLIATALAEKLAALGAQDYLASRAQRASKAGFERALAQVPDEAAAPGDEIKPG